MSTPEQRSKWAAARRRYRASAAGAIACKAARERYEATEKGKAYLKRKQSGPSGKARLARFCASEKGKAKQRRANATAWFKASVAKYNASPKGKANARKKSQKPAAKARQKAYWASEKGRLTSATKCAARKARLAGASGRHSTAEWLSLLASYHGLCAYCLKPATTRDHVVALKRGGSNDVGNIVPACARCNGSKHDTPMMVWLARRAA